ncbi:hypothetical protein ACQUFY_13855 [Robbsia andropogonis]
MKKYLVLCFGCFFNRASIVEARPVDGQPKTTGEAKWNDSETSIVA